MYCHFVSTAGMLTGLIGDGISPDLFDHGQQTIAAGGGKVLA